MDASPHVHLPIGIVPRDGNDGILDGLATMAMPEDWDNRIERTGSRPVLQSYLRYTLKQINSEGKVERPLRPGDRAAFDSGLFTPHYERIYGLVVRRNSRWDLDSFVRERDRSLRSDLAGWEFRPGRVLEVGWAHGSLAADPVVETRDMASRATDDNCCVMA